MAKEITKTPVSRLKALMATPSVQEQFKNALADGTSLFVASLIDLYGSDKYLQKCEPGKVVMEALKAATLKLPINKSLGFAYVIAYKNEPQFQIGYKGLIQLAMRTGKYRYINADCVYEGELKHHDKLTGELELGEPTGDKVIGYFAFIETINGFRKSIYWTIEQVEKHAKRFSESYKSKKDWVVKNSPWTTDFDAMAIKTLLKTLLGKYGIMSVEMAAAFDADEQDYVSNTQRDIDDNANMTTIDISPKSNDTPPAMEGSIVDAEYMPDKGGAPPAEITDEEKAEIKAAEIAEAENDVPY